MDYYKDFEDFKENYIADMEGNQPQLFVELFHFISVYDSPKNLRERLFKTKESRFNREKSSYGFAVCPVIKVETLCPLIEKVDIVYMNFDGEEYSLRVDPAYICHYPRPGKTVDNG